MICERGQTHGSLPGSPGLGNPGPCTSTAVALLDEDLKFGLGKRPVAVGIGRGEGLHRHVRKDGSHFGEGKFAAAIGIDVSRR